MKTLIEKQNIYYILCYRYVLFLYCNMERDKIVKIYLKRLNKYWECSYGAFLDNWSKAGWVIIEGNEQK